jgi:Transglycosylase-like domain
VRRALMALTLPLLGVLSWCPSPASAAVTSKVVAPIVRHRYLAAHAVDIALRFDAARIGLTPNQLRAEWQRVAVCEVGGNWSMTGPIYSGIGFLNSTWYRYGGARFAPLAGRASRDQQILIGMRVTGGWVPDQYGCSHFGW